MGQRVRNALRGSALIGFLLAAQNVYAQDTTDTAPPVKADYKILVTDEIAKDFVVNSGTPHRVSKEKVSLYKYTDVNRVLRQTAGIYIREEDGQGLRPNIGLRGTNPDRSKKVVLMEDGVLIGPAPYAAPAAYYTPFMNHIESLEVYKGFAAVPYGPNSIGGSVNYLSLGIPNTFSPSAEFSMGAFNTQNTKLAIGDYGSAGGYLIQMSRFTSDGFKKIDGGGNAGFEKNDVLVKGRLNLPAGEDYSQHLEMRLGYSDEDSNETYLGLSLPDQQANPYRRYSSSALDNMKWKHEQVQLEHMLQFENSSLKTTMYRHDFHRLWYRLEGFRGADTSKSLFNILNNPALPANQPYYNVLTGTDDSSAILAGAGDLQIAGNDRNFYSQGVQTRWNGTYNLGKDRLDFELGLRFHMDQIKRNHYLDDYSMTSFQMVRTADPRAMAAVNSNRASALTANFLTNAYVGNWVFTALGRAENVKFKYTNDLTGGTITRRGDSVFAPGAGALYKFSDLLSVKGSVNRGVSVAGLSDAGGEAKEEAINYELGLKYISQDATRQAELVVFYNDYSNITGTCTSSTGCNLGQLDLQFNGGAAVIQGVEARVAQNLYYKKLTFPLQLNMTLIDAHFDNSFKSSTPEWGIGDVKKGDPLPYVPKLQYTFTAGTVYKKFTHEFAFIYQREAYDQSAGADRREIPAFGIIDWTGRYNFTKKSQVFARVDNLLDKEYLVSLRPYGARSGKPQSFMVGLAYTF